MEKKEIDKKFYLLSTINLIPVFILGGGLTIDSGVFAVALLVLVMNHSILVKIVKSVTMSASGNGSGDASRQMARILVLMFIKFALLFGLIATIYFYKKELITKLFLIIFFQLIIQILSIKNNYQNS
jgi:hypothetical protein